MCAGIRQKYYKIKTILKCLGSGYIQNLKIYHILLIFSVSFLNKGCIEEIDLKNITEFENALVIEATITNEYKHQIINVSRTFGFEDDGPAGETNALISIQEDSQNIYSFQESFPGNYISVKEFSARSNTNYQLHIITKDGKSYVSRIAQLPQETKIDRVYAERETNNFGNEGMSVFVDSYDASGNSRYYRYEYEETYKIIAPEWNPLDLILTSNVAPFTVDLIQKTKEEQVCYKTGYSNSIIQTETTNLSEDKVSEFSIRFIPKDDFIISHRYSILIKQYVQSLEAYTYFKTLNKLSGSESLFSQAQPGYFDGNIFSVDNPNEKVLGFFEISSVTSKRIFFNYRDFFLDEPRPPYIYDCGLFSVPLNTLAGFSPLGELLNDDLVKYHSINESPAVEEGPYNVVHTECGDCTKLGTNIKPEFWED